VHERYRQTDDRQTTDGRAIAYSEREREFTFAKKGLGLLWTQKKETSRRLVLYLLYVGFRTFNITYCTSGSRRYVLYS